MSDIKKRYVYIVSKEDHMDSIRHQQLLELETRYNELHRFYFGEDHQRINGTLSVDE